MITVETRSRTLVVVAGAGVNTIGTGRAKFISFMLWSAVHSE